MLAEIGRGRDPPEFPSSSGEPGPIYLVMSEPTTTGRVDGGAQLHAEHDWRARERAVLRDLLELVHRVDPIVALPA